jgi:hypothetical protein
MENYVSYAASLSIDDEHTSLTILSEFYISTFDCQFNLSIKKSGLATSNTDPH